MTYIIDRNVTYTNLCYADCGFCAFNRHQGARDEYLLSLDEILEKCRTADAAGGNQLTNEGYADQPYIVKTDDGAFIYIEYGGRMDMSTGLLATAPTFQTAAPRYLWLNRIQAVA